MGRKANVEVLYPRTALNPHHTQRLDSLRAIRIEQSRMYRAMIRGRLSPDDATKIFFCLREIRSTVEMEITAAAAAAVAEAEAAATRAATAPRSPPQINFVVIPTGHSVIGDHVVPNKGTDALRLVHHPSPEEVSAPPVEIPPPEEPERFRDPVAIEPAVETPQQVERAAPANNHSSSVQAGCLSGDQGVEMNALAELPAEPKSAVETPPPIRRAKSAGNQGINMNDMLRSVPKPRPPRRPSWG
jgi:hypothetical protein